MTTATRPKRLNPIASGFLGVLVNFLRRADRWLYLAFAGGLTLWVGSTFFESMRLQTLHALVWSDPAGFDRVAQQRIASDFSAPLDDVFIHFDFARATARGYPFQWIEGNGYSSGGTSLLYPFVLAPGYWLGFRGLSLMLWAGMVASVGVFATLWGARVMFRGLPRPAAFVLPCVFLATGVLDWTLFSGMEVAVFLCVWTGALLAWDTLCNAEESQREAFEAAALLGLAGMLLVATRPEAVASVFVLSVSAALYRLRMGFRQGATALLLAALPGALFTVGHAVVNGLLTGDTASAGALAKLEAYHPYLTSAEVWDAWWFHTKYQVARVTNYHLADRAPFGLIIWVLALTAVFYKATRRYAVLLLALATTWVLTVATNGQVRWQNERYTMPALAWLLCAAALGLAALLSHASEWRTKASLKNLLAPVAGLLLFGLFVQHQAPRFREQVWFFGRASRNILDQHVRAGLVLRHRIQPRPKRILLSDAGALVYASELSAIDFIGLGGYERMPFARATRLGAAAGLELIERIAPKERPQVMALYPSWWGTLPLWFGKVITEVPVRGNVICGGASKVIYRADWSPFEGSDRPLSPILGQRLVGELDVADVVSEKRGKTEFVGITHVTMKIVTTADGHAMWDAGRILVPGNELSFELSELEPQKSLRLSFRAVPAQPSQLAVRFGEEKIGVVKFEPSAHWVEEALEIPADRATDAVRVRLVPEQGVSVLYHIFATQP